MQQHQHRGIGRSRFPVEDLPAVDRHITVVNLVVVDLARRLRFLGEGE
ncbi:MAG: hypothetical protein ACJ72W_01700 [Actinoallomurus sp.]